MDERGFTLIELLVGMTVLMVVMVATLTVLGDSSRMSTRENDRTMAIGEAQTGLDRMVRELRHTRLVNSATAQVLDVNVVRRGVDSRVVFDCSVAHPQGGGLRRCTRTLGGASEVLVDRVRDIGTDTSAFALTPATGTARHVTVRLGVAVDGGRAGGYQRNLVLTDGTALRNVP
jgi:prepilin-type N-terminal cleavage/methylation domain-containing protein